MTSKKSELWTSQAALPTGISISARTSQEKRSRRKNPAHSCQSASRQNQPPKKPGAEKNGSLPNPARTTLAICGGLNFAVVPQRWGRAQRPTQLTAQVCFLRAPLPVASRLAPRLLPSYPSLANLTKRLYIKTGRPFARLFLQAVSVNRRGYAWRTPLFSPHAPPVFNVRVLDVQTFDFRVPTIP